MKKALSIFLSILMILCSCTGFAASALANNFSSEIDIQKALDKNKYDSSTPLTVTVEGTYILSSRLVVYSNTTLNCEGATFIKNYQNSTLLTIVQNQAAAGLFFRADMFFTVIQSGLKRMLTSISKRALPLRLQAILTDISGQTSLSMTLKRRL